MEVHVRGRSGFPLQGATRYGVSALVLAQLISVAAPKPASIAVSCHGFPLQPLVRKALAKKRCR
ncbi:hypothetical protein CHX27_05195 [Flavobacterium aurantiibacter]|uniref:Uncharacterized protein n=1 Tax=Flavobacterium aurantiibacter TaxID=2023067 RepID=A0A255ZYV5_9FLAO|nr:hypothetical protein CHX27_05195 [Flavobacterium aurantiibacter]